MRDKTSSLATLTAEVKRLRRVVLAMGGFCALCTYIAGVALEHAVRIGG